MQEILQEIGLTRTEAKIYLTLLDLGESKAGDILKKAEINSGRIYEVLSSLEMKGFVSKIIKKGVKFFIPSPPAIIREYLNEKREKINGQEEGIDEIFPQLMKKYSIIKSKTSVEVFTGIKGMKTAYDLLLEQGKKHKELFILGIANQIKYPDSLFHLLEYDIYKQRRKLSLRIKKILDIGARKEEFWRKDNSEIRYIQLPTLTSIEILGEAVLIQIFQQEIIAILISNKQAAEDFKKQFILFWYQAKP